MRSSLQFGVRVEVPLRNKLYSAIVVEVHENLELDYKAKAMISVLDDDPIITTTQYAFWQWLAQYYCCTIGEVMNVALPSGLKLSSETRVVIHPDYEDRTDLSDDEYLISEAISIQNELTIDEVKDILNKKSVYPLIRDLMDKRVLSVKEELIKKYTPKKIGVVELTEYYLANKERLSEAFDLTQRSEHQTNALLAYVTLSKGGTVVPKSSIYDLAKVSSSVINALGKKGIFRIFEKETSRLTFDESQEALPPLSEIQEQVIADIKSQHAEQKTALLHGVTGSGKTRVYMELIQETLDVGKQVLYLLPEIALTTQIVHRLQLVFGEEVAVFHSRMSNNERVELWNEAMLGRKIILGARSSLFLPFTNLDLIIVDEEHDASYKQQDPAPRYNARDAAIYLSHLTKAKIVLGSATPSLESTLNSHRGKYALSTMTERHGKVSMPLIELIDLKYAYKTNRMVGHFSHQLRDEIKDTLMRKEQVLIFQNRRGYAPIVSCQLCGWQGECPNCDISLTYHKYLHEIKCHYCNYRTKMPSECPACGGVHLEDKGIGTEKIQSQVYELFPECRVERMDYDTVRSKNAYARILESFASREVDVLVGTQMITKGLDFDNIGLVAVINADSLVQFPDFRSGERAFQLLTQVAGRAGRRQKQGRVLIQTFNPTHPVFRDVINNAYDNFAARELRERKVWKYPPYYRMLYIQLKHRKPATVADAARYMALELKKTLGGRVLGPAEPGVARLKGLYLQNILIKSEKDPKVISYVKAETQRLKDVLSLSAGYKSVRVRLDVDPY